MPTIPGAPANIASLMAASAGPNLTLANAAKVPPPAKKKGKQLPAPTTAQLMYPSAADGVSSS